MRRTGLDTIRGFEHAISCRFADQNNQRFELRPCGRAGLDRQDRQGPPRTAKDLKPRHTRKSNCTALEDFVGVKVASTSASSPKVVLLSLHPTLQVSSGPKPAEFEARKARQ